MTEKRQSLSGVLNLRVDEALSKEIDRIATVEGVSASEAARKLLGYGVEVQRQIEASYLQLPYDTDTSKGGRVVIEAGWRKWTRREMWEMHDEAMAEHYEAEQYPDL